MVVQQWSIGLTVMRSLVLLAFRYCWVSALGKHCVCVTVQCKNWEGSCG